MKSILFEVDALTLKCKKISEESFIWGICIPLLPAFSVEYLSIKDRNLSSLISGEECIVGENLVINAGYEVDEYMDKILIELHYHGIKDYSSLFPKVVDTNLRERLGLFYEEAEKNFSQGSWLSFALMCGAVFEGMLYAKLSPAASNNTFSLMIIDAHSKGVINDKQRDIMNIVRISRNLVHANKIRDPYISRKNAMEIRATLDKLIKDFSL